MYLGTPPRAGGFETRRTALSPRPMLSLVMFSLFPVSCARTPNQQAQHQALTERVRPDVPPPSKIALRT